MGSRTIYSLGPSIIEHRLRMTVVTRLVRDGDTVVNDRYSESPMDRH